MRMCSPRSSGWTAPITARWPGDTELADAVKLLARAHQNLIWERVRHVLRLRSALLDFFPVAVQAFSDLAATDALILLGRAPDPARAAKLTRSQIVSALTAARRHHIQNKAEPLQALLRQPGLRQPAAVEAAYAAIVLGQVKMLTAINEQVAAMQSVMSANFDRHPAAQIYLSQPGLGPVLAARVLDEFGDDPKRFASSRARKNYSGQSPITRASGKKSVVLARYATNRRLGVALHLQAYGALNGPAGTRAYYDTIRTRGTGHHAALRQVANRLVGILHGCLHSGTLYNEATAWNNAAITTQQMAPAA